MPDGRAGAGYIEIRPELTDGFVGDLSRQVAAAVARVRESVVVDVRANADKIASDLKAATPAAQSAGSEVGDSAGGGIISGIGGKLSGVGSMAATGLVAATATVAAAGAAVGAAAGASIVAGTMESIEREGIVNKIQARLGLDESGAAAVKARVASVYGQAFGESFADVGDAMGTVQQGLRGLVPDNAIEDVTRKVITMRDVFGADFNETVRAAGNLVRNGLAPDVNTALDMITVGFQRGADQGDEFLDTLNEYAQPVKDLGLSGEQFIAGLISGADQGVWSVDKIGDALKELQIRAIDGSKLTGESFTKLGLPADQMAQAFANGGEDAKRAMGLTLSALAGMRDKVAQDAAGVGLFGTMWEDIGPQVILGLQPGQLALGEFGGAAQKAADQSGEGLGAMIETWKRSGQNALAGFADQTIAPALARIGAAFNAGGLSGAFDEIGAIASEWWAVLQPQLAQLWTDLQAWLVANGPAIAEKAQELGKGFIEWAYGLAGRIFDALGPFLTSLGEWVQNTAVPYIESNWQSWVSAFLAWFGPMWSELQGKLLGFLFDLGKWIVTDAAPWIIAKVSEWTWAFMSWLGGAIKDLPGKLLEWLGALGSWVLADALPALGRFGTDMLNAFVAWLKDLPGKAASAGGDLIAGLWQGLKDKLREVLDGIGGLAAPLVDAFKSAFGIASPAKVMMPIGEQIAAGLAVGFGHYNLVDALSANARADLAISGGMAIPPPPRPIVPAFAAAGAPSGLVINNHVRSGADAAEVADLVTAKTIWKMQR